MVCKVLTNVKYIAANIFCYVEGVQLHSTQLSGYVLSKQQTAFLMIDDMT